MTDIKVLVLHGPNLNLLGRREPQHYGRLSLGELDERIVERGRELGLVVECAQSNHEGVLIDRLQQARDEGWRAVVLNAGGLTHTSVSLRDAVVACGIPVIEVHLSNIGAREEFRQRSLITGVADGIISGLGPLSYLLGLEAAAHIIRHR